MYVAESSSSTDAEIICIELFVSKNHYYRPPNNDSSSIVHLKESLQAIHANHESNSAIIILCGDFNLPDISWENGCGHVHPSTSYGTEINNSLINICII